MTAQEKSVKSVSMEQLESAFGAALAELLGRPYSVHIAKLESVVDPVQGLMGIRDSFRIEMSGSVTKKPHDPDLPF